MNDELLYKIISACDKSSDMVCWLQDLAQLDGWPGFDDLRAKDFCYYREGDNPMGCLKCMAEIVDWLRSEGVI